MGKLDSYNIELKSLPDGITQMEYLLDNGFFAKIGSDDVQRGSVTAKIEIKHSNRIYELLFSLEGQVVITCDRCLDDMELSITTEQRLVVKFGKEFAEEGDDVVVVPEEDGAINISWFLYEFIVLCIPIKHVHPFGKCNKEMTEVLYKHSVQKIGEEDYESLPTDGEATEHPMDPRWETLKKLKED